MQRCCSFLLLLLLVGGLSCCTFAAAVTHYKVTEDGTVAVAVEQRAAAAGSSSSSDAALVGQHLTVEIPGNRGLLRLLLGLTLLLGVYAYAAANVYPRLDSTYQRLVMKAEDFGDSVFGVEPKSKLQHMLERLEKYGEDHPVELSSLITLFVLGLSLFLNGVRTMKRGKRIRLVGV